MATTPPPPSLLREPPTPKHGAGYHAYEPYSTRHSARLASQRSRDAHITPPPASPKKGTYPQRATNLHALSPPASGTISPRKKSTRAKLAANDNIGLDLSHLSDAQGSSTRKQSRHPSSFVTSMAISGTLPTPAKTPRKKTVEESASTARVLFPSSSTPRSKKAKKYAGFSLDSFHEGSSENPDKIAIFTDSRDRVPVVDDSGSNPFKKQSESKVPVMESKTSHTYKRRKLASPNDASADEAPTEAVKRDDGMLYVFRGKKTFRKFQDQGMEEEPEEDDDDLGLFADRPDLLDDSVDLSVRPMTRSSIKPRVLFPSVQEQQTEDPHSLSTDEEATTDIEEHPEAIEGDDITHSADTDMETASSNSRSLRSRAAKVPEIHGGMPPGVAIRKENRRSPFAVWMRKKQSPIDASILASKKREADSSPSVTSPVAKKTRGK